MLKKNIYLLLSFLVLFMSATFTNQTESLHATESESTVATQTSESVEQENQLIPMTQEEINQFIAGLDDGEKAIFDKFLAIFKENINTILSTEEFKDVQNLLKEKKIFLNIGIQFLFHKMKEGSN
jgi:hypothetical protein